MIHDFGIVWSERDLLLSGLGNTTILSVLSAAAALLIGFALTPALMSKRASPFERRCINWASIAGSWIGVRICESIVIVATSSITLSNVKTCRV